MRDATSTKKREPKSGFEFKAPIPGAGFWLVRHVPKMRLRLLTHCCLQARCLEQKGQLPSPHFLDTSRHKLFPDKQFQCFNVLQQLSATL